MNKPSDQNLTYLMKHYCFVGVDRNGRVLEWNFTLGNVPVVWGDNYNRLLRRKRRQNAVILLLGWCGATFPEIHAHVLRRTGG